MTEEHSSLKAVVNKHPTLPAGAWVGAWEQSGPFDGRRDARWLKGANDHVWANVCINWMGILSMAWHWYGDLCRFASITCYVINFYLSEKIKDNFTYKAKHNNTLFLFCFIQVKYVFLIPEIVRHSDFLGHLNCGVVSCLVLCSGWGIFLIKVVLVNIKGPWCPS